MGLEKLLTCIQGERNNTLVQNNESITINLYSPTGKTDYWGGQDKEEGLKPNSKNDKVNLNLFIRNENFNNFHQDK